jgi:periplasmic protein TonB
MERFVLNRGNHPAGVLAVVVLHIIFGYALLNGLGRTIVNAITAAPPITFIQEISKPTPPEPVRTKPKPAPAPDVSVPIPEIPIVAPPDPVAIAVPQAAPSAPDTTAIAGADNNAPTLKVRKEFGAAYRVQPTYPREAQRQGIMGRVVAHVFVAPEGNVTRVVIVSSTNPVFDREVVRALLQWKFNPEAVGFVGEYEIAFNLKD